MPLLYIYHALLQSILCFILCSVFYIVKIVFAFRAIRQFVFHFESYLNACIASAIQAFKYQLFMGLTKFPEEIKKWTRLALGVPVTCSQKKLHQKKGDG